MKFKLILLALFGLTFLAVVGFLVYTVASGRLQGKDSLIAERNKLAATVKEQEAKLGSLPATNRRLEEEIRLHGQKVEGLNAALEKARQDADAKEAALTKQSADMVVFKDNEIKRVKGLYEAQKTENGKLNEELTKLQKNWSGELASAKEALKVQFKDDLSERDDLRKKLAAKTAEYNVAMASAAAEAKTHEEAIRLKDKKIDELQSSSGDAGAAKREAASLKDENERLGRQIADLRTTNIGLKTSVQAWSSWAGGLSSLSEEFSGIVEQFGQLMWRIPAERLQDDAGQFHIVKHKEQAMQHKETLKSFRTKLSRAVDTHP